MHIVSKLTPLIVMGMIISCTAGCDDDAAKAAPSTSVTELRKFVRVPGAPRSVMWDTVTLSDDRGLLPGPGDWGLVAYLDYAQGGLRGTSVDGATTMPEIRMTDLLLLRDWLPARVKRHLARANGAIVAKTVRGLKVLSPKGIGKSPLLSGCVLVNETEDWCLIILWTM